MLDKEQIAQIATDEKEKEAYFNTIIGLYFEALNEIDAHKEELDEITEYFTTTLEWPKETNFTRLFQIFFMGVGKGVELLDRIEKL